MVTIEYRTCNDLDKVYSKQEWNAYIRTMYKRKDRKINPVNTPLPNGINPGDSANFGGAHEPPYHLGRIWLLEGEYNDEDLTLGRYLETLQ